MRKNTKALLYNFLGFAVFYLPLYFLIKAYTQLSGLWIPVTSAVVSTLISPKFQAIRSNMGEKIYMRWIFVKGVKEVK